VWCILHSLLRARDPVLPTAPKDAVTKRTEFTNRGQKLKPIMGG
jgi:hypothetical protein